jgi:type I restriction enzyme M protein
MIRGKRLSISLCVCNGSSWTKDFISLAIIEARTMANNNSEIERRLWASADEFRANSKLKSSEYSVPVLGLIFLRYADHRFTRAEKELAGKGSGRRAIGKEDYQAKGVMYLPQQARFSKLLALPEGENIGLSPRT